MNLKEIEQIKDFELRSIRLKYWNLRHKAFLDEHGVSDSMLEKVWDDLYKQEELEIEEYNKKCVKTDNTFDNTIIVECVK